MSGDAVPVPPAATLPSASRRRLARTRHREADRQPFAWSRRRLAALSGSSAWPSRRPPVDAPACADPAERPGHETGRAAPRGRPARRGCATVSRDRAPRKRRCARRRPAGDGRHRRATEEIKAPLLGSHYLLSLRALLVGRTLVGLRVDDVLRAIDWLLARPDADGGTSRSTAPERWVWSRCTRRHSILEIGRVVVENSLVTWRAIVDQPLHRNAAEVVVPGVLRRYDLPDLVASIAPRPVAIVNPVDALGNPLRRADARQLGPTASRVKARRAPGSSTFGWCGAARAIRCRSTENLVWLSAFGYRRSERPLTALACPTPRNRGR